MNEKTPKESQYSILEMKEMIALEIKKIMNENDLPFDSDEMNDEAMKAAMSDMGDEFQPIGSSEFERGLNPEDFSAEINQAQMGLDSDEEEFKRISDIISKIKSHEDRFGAGSINENESISEAELFQAKDANGVTIKRNALVKSIDGGDKKGRVIGFGDDGKGSQVVIVDYQWPTDMKFGNPQEMGKKNEYPQDIIIQGMNEELNEETLNETLNPKTWDKIEYVKNLVGIDTIFDEFVRKMDDSIVNQVLHSISQDYNLNIPTEEYVDGLEEMTGLGSGVKRTGDRNQNLRDDHSHAPLHESLSNNIKTLFEGKVTKKQLDLFIKEEAKKMADGYKK